MQPARLFEERHRPGGGVALLRCVAVETVIKGLEATRRSEPIIKRP